MKPGDLAKYASELERQAAIGALAKKVVKGAAGVAKEYGRLPGQALDVAKRTKSVTRTGAAIGRNIASMSTPAKVVGAAGAGYVAAKAT
jgi:hypothetical protein